MVQNIGGVGGNIALSGQIILRGGASTMVIIDNTSVGPAKDILLSNGSINATTPFAESLLFEGGHGRIVAGDIGTTIPLAKVEIRNNLSGTFGAISAASLTRFFSTLIPSVGSTTTTFNGPVDITGNATLDGANLIFADRLRIGGAASFNSANLIAGSVSVGGRTTIAGDTVLITSAANGSITLASIDGAQASTQSLTLKSGGGTISHGLIGVSVPLKQCTINGISCTLPTQLATQPSTTTTSSLIQQQAYLSTGQQFAPPPLVLNLTPSLLNTTVGSQKLINEIKSSYSLADIKLIAQDAQYAQLANAAYNAAYKSGDPAPVGWHVIPGGSGALHDVPGFSATVYQNDTTGEVVVAFRGTVGTFPSGEDWHTDLYQLGLGVPVNLIPEMKLAFDLAKAMQQRYGNVTFTGHSLGGAMAQYAAVELGGNVKAIAFDPAPLSSSLLAAGKGNIASMPGGVTTVAARILPDYPNITNFRGPNDPVTGFATALSGAITDTGAPVVGRPAITLNTDPSVPVWIEAAKFIGIDPGYDPFAYNHASANLALTMTVIEHVAPSIINPLDLGRLVLTTGSPLAGGTPPTPTSVPSGNTTTQRPSPQAISVQPPLVAAPQPSATSASPSVSHPSSPAPSPSQVQPGQPSAVSGYTFRPTQYGTVEVSSNGRIISTLTRRPPRPYTATFHLQPRAAVPHLSSLPVAAPPSPATLQRTAPGSVSAYTFRRTQYGAVEVSLNGRIIATMTPQAASTTYGYVQP